QEKQRSMADAGKGLKGNDLNAGLNMMVAMDAAQKEMIDVLDPEQQTRYRQISLQFLGPAAFTDDKTAADLELTAEQKKKVAGIVDKSDSDMQAAAMDAMKGGPGKMKEMQKKMQDRKKATAETILAVLTPAQADKWKTMQGASFKFP